MPAQEGARLEFVGRLGGMARAIETSDGLAYLGSDQRLTILDISIPGMPQELGTYEDLPGDVLHLVTRNQQVFAAMGDAGIGILDVSDPAAPHLVASLDTPGEALSTTIVGNVVYVADGSSGLQIVDLGDASEPRIVGSADTPRVARTVAVVDDTAFVAERDSWESVIRAFDVSDPAQPTETEFFDTQGGADTLAVAGDHLIVGGIGLYVYDIREIGQTSSEPRASRQLAAPVRLQFVHDIVVAGPRIFALTDRIDIWRFDEPPLLEHASSSKTVDTPYDMALAGDVVLVADGEAGLRILRLLSPDMLYDIGAYEVPGSSTAIALRDGAAYIADPIRGVRAIDLGDPTRPAAVGFVVAGGRAHDVAIGPDIPFRGSYVTFVGEARQETGGNTRYVGALALADINEPLIPELAGELTWPLRRDWRPTPLLAVTVDGIRAYAISSSRLDGGSDALWILSTANPARPSVMGRLPLTTDPSDVAYTRGFAFIADREAGLLAVSVDDPTRPELVAEVQTSGEATGLAIAGDTLYLAAGSAGLLTFDITDPADPLLEGSVDTLGDARRVSVDGTHALVADGPAGIRLIEVSDPAQPLELASYATPAEAEDVAASRGLVYASVRGHLLVLRIVEEAPGLTPSPPAESPTAAASQTPQTSTATPTPRPPHSIYLPAASITLVSLR